MKYRLPLLGVLFLAVSLPAPSQQTPETKSASKAASKPEDAQVMLDAALQKAKAQKKPVLVVFDASW